MAQPRVGAKDGTLNETQRDLRSLSPWGADGLSNYIESTGADDTVPNTAVDVATAYELADIVFTGVGGVVRLGFQTVLQLDVALSPQMNFYYQYSTDGGATWTDITTAADNMLARPGSTGDLAVVNWAKRFSTVKQVRYTVRMVAYYTAAAGANVVNYFHPTISVEGNIAQVS